MFSKRQTRFREQMKSEFAVIMNFILSCANTYDNFWDTYLEIPLDKTSRTASDLLNLYYEEYDVRDDEYDVLVGQIPQASRLFAY